MANKVFSLSLDFIDKLGASHEVMTQTQRAQNKIWRTMGIVPTVRDQAKLGLRAMENGGIPTPVARALMVHALRDLRAQGVKLSELTNVWKR